MLSFPYLSNKFPLFSHHSNSFYHQLSYHFLSTVAEGHYSMDFIPFLFNKHTNPTKWSMRIMVTLEPLFLPFSSSILRCLLLFWLLYTLKMSKYYDYAKDFQLSLCGRRAKPRLISKLNRGLNTKTFILMTSQHNRAT